MSRTLSDSVLHAEPVEAARTRPASWKRWPKLILLILLLLWAADSGASLLIQHSRLQRALTRRLESVFGRPVEVGSYSLSLWNGPALEARSLEVGEDPRFGHEYFLRAESLTVRLRWQSLLAGRLELGTLSLSHPSLNLVRNPDGDWNLAEWLPRPTAQGGQTSAAALTSAPAAKEALRFGRIDVVSGRINFKRGDDKLPFALASVNGFLEPDGPGRWRMDLEAIPSRAAVTVQQAGVLHLVGHLGGTSSRLRPAALDFSWQGASISDVLRLTRSYDYGVRGTLALAVNAQTEGDIWGLEGRAEMRQLHRWDLSLRTDNPSINLVAKTKLDLGSSRLDLIEATLEAPHSNAHASGGIEWGHAPVSRPKASSSELRLTSATVALSDVFAWFRAFHSDVADDISLDGSANLDATLRGWPPQIYEGTLTIDGARLTGPRLPQPVTMNPTQIRLLPEGIRMKSTTIIFGAQPGPPAGPPAGIIWLDESLEPEHKGFSNLRFVGGMRQVRDFFSTARALGWNPSRGWDLAGTANFEFVWLGARFPWQAETNGNVIWGDGPVAASVRTPFLTQPIEQIKAVASFRKDALDISINSAEAFGARWKGNLFRPSRSSGWQFSLSADHMSAAELDRWLNPRGGRSLLDRMLPFLNPRSPTNSSPETLHANGRISVDQFTLAPFVVRHLQGSLKMEGRRIELAGARALFYGGNIGGSLDAQLEAAPAYHVGLNFSHVDLSALSAATTKFSNFFTGDASGEISFSARGATRADLVNSLACQGTARATAGELRSINLEASLHDAAHRSGSSTFREVSAAFSCADRQVQFQNLLLIGAEERIEGSGSVDFSEKLDMRLRQIPAASAARTANASLVSGKTGKSNKSDEASFQLTGSLAAPTITRNETPERPR